MRLWRTARRIPLHRWLSQRPVISPVPHRPVRRVSPPLREGRPLPPACPVLDTGSFRRKSKMRPVACRRCACGVSKMRLWRVEDAPVACRRCACGVSKMRLWRVEDAPVACRRRACGVSKMRLWRTESRRGRAWSGQHAQSSEFNSQKRSLAVAPTTRTPEPEISKSTKPTDQRKEQNPNNYRAAAPGEPVEPRGNPADGTTTPGSTRLPRFPPFQMAD